MFDIGFSEMAVVGVIALIVVGPKDLPRMFRTVGEFTGKARKMAREFQSAMNDAAKDSGVGDIAGDLRKIADPKQFGIDKVKEATSELSAWSPDAADGRVAPKTGDAARAAAEAAELSGEPELVPDPAAPEPAKPAPTDADKTT